MYFVEPAVLKRLSPGSNQGFKSCGSGSGSGTIRDRMHGAKGVHFEKVPKLNYINGTLAAAADAPIAPTKYVDTPSFAFVG